jgi:hypothetical protein
MLIKVASRISRPASLGAAVEIPHRRDPLPLEYVYIAMQRIVIMKLTSRQAGFIPGAHWNATKGWDPTTGFGTPNFKKLLSLIQSI